MAKRLKMTGFARFFLVMIILAPLAFIGASIYNGEDPTEKLNELLGKKEATTEYVQPEQEAEATTSLSDQIEALEARIEKLESDNQELKKQLDEKEQEILYLKDKINQIQ